MWKEAGTRLSRKERSRGNTEEARHLQAALRTLGTPRIQEVEYRSLQPANVPACAPGPHAPPPPKGTVQGKVL